VEAPREQQLGLVVGLPEGRTVLEVIELPERPLRVGEPEVQVLPEHVPPEPGLEADLERHFRPRERAVGIDLPPGSLVRREVVGKRQRVVRSVERDPRLAGAGLLVEKPQIGEIGRLGGGRVGGRRDSGLVGGGRPPLRRPEQSGQGRGDDEREEKTPAESSGECGHGNRPFAPKAGPGLQVHLVAYDRESQARDRRTATS
jgi:hypothetical protein